MSASYEVRGSVAVITLNNPPVNGLGYDTRREFSAGIERAEADAAVAAIVVTGAGKAFSGGADIKEFGKVVAGQSKGHNLLPISFLRQRGGAPACTTPLLRPVWCAATRSSLSRTVTRTPGSTWVSSAPKGKSGGSGRQ